MNTAPRPALSAALDGCTIVIAVDRRSLELAAALERHGAAVRHAPALTIVPHIDDEALIARTRELIESPPDIVVATTGVGFRGWMEAADEAGLLDDLHSAIAGAQIVARGPKARGAIQQAGFTADWVAESETSAELGDYLLGGLNLQIEHHVYPWLPRARLRAARSGVQARCAAAGLPYREAGLWSALIEVQRELARVARAARAA